MKSFNEFKTESYSRLDEGLASQLWNRAGGAVTGNMIYNTVGSDVGKHLPGKDGKKATKSKTNMKGHVASGIVGGFSDQIIKKGWKYGVKPTYSLAKWGVTKGIPGAVTTAGKIIGAFGAMNKMP